MVSTTKRRRFLLQFILRICVTRKRNGCSQLGERLKSIFAVHMVGKITNTKKGIRGVSNLLWNPQGRFAICPVSIHRETAAVLYTAP